VLHMKRRGRPFDLEAELEMVLSQISKVKTVNYWVKKNDDARFSLVFRTGDFYRVISLTRLGKNL
jgi:hypothetical protein